MTQLPKTIMLDLTHDTILSQVKELQAERGLTNCEMELVLTKVLNDIKTAKEKDYSETILDLVFQLQQQEKRDNEPIMTLVNENGEKVQMDNAQISMDIDKVEFTPDDNEPIPNDAPEQE